MTESYTFLDDPVCRIKFEFGRGRVFIHCRPFAEGPLVVRRVLQLRHEIAAVLRAIGYRKAYAFFPDNPRWQKVCRRLGFVTMFQRRGWVLMEVVDG